MRLSEEDIIKENERRRKFSSQPIPEQVKIKISDMSAGTVSQLETALGRSMKDQGYSADQLKKHVQKLLLDKACFLDDHERLVPNSPYGECNLYELRNALTASGDLASFPAVLHMLRILGEQYDLLTNYIEPEADRLCRSVRRLGGEVLMITAACVPDARISIFHKAFHFNNRIGTDELLFLLNRLANHFSKSIPAQPSTKFMGFFKQVQKEDLSYFPPTILNEINQTLDLMCMQRLIRNTLKTGGEVTYSPVLMGGKWTLTCTLDVSRNRNDVTYKHLAQKRTISSSGILNFEWSKDLWLVYNGQLSLLYAIWREVVKASDS